MTFFEDNLRALGRRIDSVLGAVMSWARRSRPAAGPSAGRFRLTERSLQDRLDELERWLRDRGIHLPVAKYGRSAAAVFLLLVIVIGVASWRLTPAPPLDEVVRADMAESDALSRQIIAQRAAEQQQLPPPKVRGRR